MTGAIPVIFLSLSAFYHSVMSAMMSLIFFCVMSPFLAVLLDPGMDLGHTHVTAVIYCHRIIVLGQFQISIILTYRQMMSMCFRSDGDIC